MGSDMLAKLESWLEADKVRVVDLIHGMSPEAAISNVRLYLSYSHEGLVSVWGDNEPPPVPGQLKRKPNFIYAGKGTTLSTLVRLALERWEELYGAKEV